MSSSAPAVPASVRAEDHLADALAVVSGYVDAFGYFRYRTFVSFMSGNTTQTGIRIGQGALSGAEPGILAILCYTAGVFGSWLLFHSGSRDRPRWIIGCVAGLLALGIIAEFAGILGAWVELALLALAMGVMNTTESQVGAQPINLVFVTGTLNNMARHLALALRRAPLADSQGPWDSHGHRVVLLARLWLGFLVGAVLSATITIRIGGWALLFPMLFLLGLAAFDRARSLVT